VFSADCSTSKTGRIARRTLLGAIFIRNIAMVDPSLEKTENWKSRQLFPTTL